MPTTTQLQAVYLRSNLAVTITDPNGRITWCNAAFCTMLGTSDSALIGQPLTTLDTSNAPGDDAEVASSGLEAGTDPGVAHRRLVHASGHTVQTCSTTTRACAEDGSTCWITQWFDLTTHHIEREQQETAQRMQALSDFAGRVAHDVNNVLTSLQANAALIQDMPLDPLASDCLEDVLFAAEAGSQITRQLLNLSNARAPGAYRLDLGQLVLDHRADLLALVPEATLTIEAQTGAWMVGEPEPLLEALSQLIRNTVPAQRVQLDVQVKDEAVEVSITDDGPGMTEEVRRRAFEPYFTTRRRRGGTGLGLTQVYGIVSRCAGRIHIDSSEGRGATITMQWPFAQERPAEAPAARAPAVERDTARPVLLLVDDDDAIRRVLARALATSGYEVVEASGVKEAQARFERHSDRVSLLLTDVVMPDGDGQGLARYLSQRQPGLPVLFMSGYAPRSLAPLGADALTPLLQKPFTTQHVVDAVQDLV